MYKEVEKIAQKGSSQLLCVL